MSRGRSNLKIKTNIREMKSIDIEAVISIEKDVHKQPWSRKKFEDSLLNGYFCRVVESSSRVLAYIIVSHFSSHEAEVLNIAVEKSSQKKGIGTSLMDYVLVRLTALGRSEIFLEVRETNSNALRDYSKLGFVEVGRRSNYYGVRRQKKEDALIMNRKLQKWVEKSR